MKRLTGLLLAITLALVPASTALAESLKGSNEWNVTFTEAEKMVDNYSQKEWADDIYQLQPGDDVTFAVTLKHEHGTKADWYMSNEVIKSLEDARTSYATDANDPKDSAYEYLLTYTGANGQTRTLYDSKTVGGNAEDKEEEQPQGLNEATEALDEFFYLDTLSKGQTAKVNLKVSLDGETEGNDYFDTLAQLKMKFAVELQPDTPGTPRRKIVRTGDETNLLPFYLAMVVSGTLLAVLAVQGISERKSER